MKKSPSRILVLSGGTSRERAVSLRSGMAVADACREIGYQVVSADIDAGNLSALKQPHDVVFPVLHGSFGEDGQLQKILEENGKPFVGSKSTASCLAFDKSKTKAIWQRNDISTPTSIVIDAAPAISDLPNSTRFCCKPTREGSSFGVKFADSPQEAIHVIQQQLAEYSELILEEFIAGQELTVGIVDGNPLPIIEIRPQSEFYDYDAKYQRSDTQYIVPAELSNEITTDIQNMALEAFTLLGCEHYGRVDLILHPSRGPFFLEINTIPGFTQTSLLPKAALAFGMPFNRLVENLVDLALSNSHVSPRTTLD